MSSLTFHRNRPHPWHGLTVGENAPEVVNVYVEMTPFDSVKYEVDKETGFLSVDRPQKFSSQLPALYGFIPRTYCGGRVGALSESVDKGDHDPLDICVFSERPIDRTDILLSARIIGGLHMIDGGEADDKIIAVLDGDLAWGHARDIEDIPKAFIERLRHYFLTYKMAPEDKEAKVEVDIVYGAEQAFKVLQASMDDYNELIGE